MADKKPTKKTAVKKAPARVAKAEPTPVPLTAPAKKAAPSAAKAPTPKPPARKTAAKKTATKKTATASGVSPAKKLPAPRAAVAPKTRKVASKPTPAKAPPAAKPKAAASAPKTAKSARDVPVMETGMTDPQTAMNDMARFAETVADVNQRTRNILNDVTNRAANRAHDAGRKAPEAADPDPLGVQEAAGEVATALMSDPAKMAELGMDLWTNYTALFGQVAARMAGQETGEPVAAPAQGDRRFGHPSWTENPMLDMVKQTYLLTQRWLDRAIDEADGLDDNVRRRARFHADQMMSAMSPSNVPALNPTIVDETIRTKGENLVRGARNFVEDLERGHGELAIKQADMDAFEVGVNVATTPGKVVFQNRMFQLIQYNPTTPRVAERPLLIFPPWINKFYILDLQPENSFIKWAVDQGRTVFVVSWVNPGPEMRDVGFEDYMHEGVFEALDAVGQAAGTPDVDAIGYCIGGTLLACALAYMARKGDERIKTATFFTAQTDFSEAGDLKVFTDDHQLTSMEKRIEASGGIFEGHDMARTFNMLRPNDLIWAAFVDNYFLGKDAKKFDLLYWNADATRMTGACHSWYLRKFYRQNALAEGTLRMSGEPIQLENIKIPAFFQAGEKDHIAPPRSVYKSAQLFGGKALFMLAGSGHIAGVVNPPSKKKYHYRTADDLPDTMEQWVEGADLHEHSWWPYWDKWLTSKSPGTVPARQPGDGALPVIEDAPGSYVRVRSD